MARRSYAAESQRLAAAIDCALAAVRQHPPAGFSLPQVEHFIAVYTGIRQAVLHPPAAYQNLASLAYSVQDVFTYFQEAAGEDVEYFWRQVQHLELGYQRQDNLQKILRAGKIKNQVEYAYVTDSLVAARQANSITSEQAARLSAFIGKFEEKRS